MKNNSILVENKADNLDDNKTNDNAYEETFDDETLVKMADTWSSV